MKPRIFCGIESGKGTRDLVVVAVAEDGMRLAEHVSSSEAWAMNDIGCSDAYVPAHGVGTPGGPDHYHQKAVHEVYREHYPDGYQMVWIGDWHDPLTVEEHGS